MSKESFEKFKNINNNKKISEKYKNINDSYNGEIKIISVSNRKLDELNNYFNADGDKGIKFIKVNIGNNSTFQTAEQIAKKKDQTIQEFKNKFQ